MAEELERDNEVEEVAGTAATTEGVAAEAPRERRPPMRRSGPPRGGQFDGGRSSGPYRRPGQFQPRRRGCMFCADKGRVIDWKDVDGLRRFVNDNGDMRPRRKTGTCAKHQRRLAQAIKRARMIALLPYTSEHVRVQGGGRH